MILIAIFFLGYALRVMFLPENILTFGYDQARDAVISQQILRGDLKIQGPPASTPGLFHGVFYYYLLAPAYYFGEGSPIAAAYFIAFLNSLAVFAVFYLGYLLSGKKMIAGFLASFLFAVSFESVQYATWLSNPTTSVLTIPLMYLGLWLWITSKNKFAPVITAVFFGLSIQSEIFLAYHAIPIIIWLAASRKNINAKQVLSFWLFLLLSVSTMIVNEFKFGLKGVGGVLSLISSQESNLAYAKSLGDYLLLYLNQIGRIYAFNSYPANIGMGGGFVLALAVYSLIKKEKAGLFLSTILFSHLSVVSMGGISTPFLMVGIGPAVSVMISLSLVKWWQSGFRPVALAVLAILIYGNISTVLRENPKGSTLFAIQKDMLLSKQIALIDYTYNETGGESFSINSLTSPLWINIVWDYLFEWHGQKSYGYIPSWHGKSQIGQITSLPQDDKKTKNYFLIIEPMGGIPPQYRDIAIGEEDLVSKILEEKTYGELTVQKRIKL